MPDEQQMMVDTETYIRVLMMQRNSALDAVAQLEARIAVLTKEIAALKAPNTSPKLELVNEQK